MSGLYAGADGLVFVNVTVSVFCVSHEPMELGDIVAAAVTLTARVAVVDALAYVDERQSGSVAELPSGPHAQ